MQLRLQPKNSRKFITIKFVIRTVLFALILFLAIFLLDKIKVKNPSKLIKHEISNDKLITIK